MDLLHCLGELDLPRTESGQGYLFEWDNPKTGSWIEQQRLFGQWTNAWIEGLLAYPRLEIVLRGYSPRVKNCGMISRKASMATSLLEGWTEPKTRLPCRAFDVEKDAGC